MGHSLNGAFHRGLDNASCCPEGQALASLRCRASCPRLRTPCSCRGFRGFPCGSGWPLLVVPGRDGPTIALNVTGQTEPRRGLGPYMRSGTSVSLSIQWGRWCAGRGHYWEHHQPFLAGSSRPQAALEGTGVWGLARSCRAAPRGGWVFGAWLETTRLPLGGRVFGAWPEVVGLPHCPSLGGCRLLALRGIPAPFPPCLSYGFALGLWGPCAGTSGFGAWGGGTLGLTWP